MRDTERAGSSTLRNDGQMGVSGTVLEDGVMSDDVDGAGCWANLKEEELEATELVSFVL